MNYAILSYSYHGNMASRYLYVSIPQILNVLYILPNLEYNNGSRHIVGLIVSLHILFQRDLSSDKKLRVKSQMYQY